MKKFSYFIIAVFIISLVVGCSGNKVINGEATLISKEKTPSWAENPEKASDKKQRAFIGMSRQYSMEQDARTDARRDAYKQAAEALGVFVESKIKEVTTKADMGNNIINPAIAQDEINKMESSGITAGKIEEYYIQKYQKTESDRVEYFYVAYCKYMVPKDFARDYVAQQLKKQHSKSKAKKEQQKIERALKMLDEMNFEDF